MGSQPQEEISRGKPPKGPSETTTLIGRRWKHGDVLSWPVLIAREACHPPASRGHCGSQGDAERNSTRRKNPAAMSEGPHPYPSRTRKLSPLEPMVLHGRLCGRVGSCRNPFWALSRKTWQGSFFFLKKSPGYGEGPHETKHPSGEIWGEKSFWGRLGGRMRKFWGWLWKDYRTASKKIRRPKRLNWSREKWFHCPSKKRWIPRANCHPDYYSANILSVIQSVVFPWSLLRKISLRCSWWSNITSSTFTE